eukprot:gene10821-64711_t
MGASLSRRASGSLERTQSGSRRASRSPGGASWPAPGDVAAVEEEQRTLLRRLPLPPGPPPATSR